MPTAVWNGEVIAESSKIKKFDGREYFPKTALNKKFFKESPTLYISADKGKARFFNVFVDDKVYWNAAWYYIEPRDTAKEIKNHVAFAADVSIDSKK